MLARCAVLLTHSVSVRPADLIPCKRIASVTPLFARLTKSARLHHSTVFSHPLFSYACALFCAFLHLPKAQSFVIKRFRTLCQKRRGCGGGVHLVGRSIHCLTSHSSRITIHHPLYHSTP